jgi:hypothetical protein
MEILIMGVALAFNILVILWKMDNDQKLNAILDGIILVLLTIVFGGSTAALMIGTIASLIISIYLFLNPPELRMFSKLMGVKESKKIRKERKLEKKYKKYKGVLSKSEIEYLDNVSKELLKKYY